MRKLFYLFGALAVGAMSVIVASCRLEDNEVCLCDYNTINGKTETMRFDSDDLDHYGVKNCRELQRELSVSATCRAE